MKPGTYTSGHASCKLRHSQIVAPTLRGRLLEVLSINTPEAHRGKGQATRLIQKLNRLADCDRICLLLKPEPFDGSTMDVDALAAWYGKYGYVVLQERPVLLLVRPWQSPKTSLRKLANDLSVPRPTMATHEY